MNAKVPINIVSIFTYYCMLIIKFKSIRALLVTFSINIPACLIRRTVAVLV